jgi:hypothetical protein
LQAGEKALVLRKGQPGQKPISNSRRFALRHGSPPSQHIEGDLRAVPGAALMLLGCVHISSRNSGS